jgi:ABC-type uncharacterized transport system YnjBCD permease subunit
MVPVVVESTGATLTTAVDVAVELGPVPSRTVNVYVVSWVMGPQLKSCGEAVVAAGVQVDVVVPAVATREAEAPVPPPNTARSGRPAFPAVYELGPVKLVIVGLFTFTVTVVVAPSPA